MSFAGGDANSNGCVAKPKEHATGLIGFAAQIRRSSLIGSCAMETAEHREPCESRGSRTDLGAPGGEIPPGDSTFTLILAYPRRVRFTSVSDRTADVPRGPVRAISRLMHRSKRHVYSLTSSATARSDA